MTTRLKTSKCPHILRQLAVIILIKILVLTCIWYVLIRGRKIDGSTEGLATYFLTEGATPQPKTKPGSIWH